MYGIAMEEYRFQVRLNADRSRDYVVLNSAIIAAAIGLLGAAKMPILAAALFLGGVVVAVFAILGTHTQHGYYREARDAKSKLERLLGIEDLGLVERRPSESRLRRFGSVTSFNYAILALLCVLDVTGAVVSLRSAAQAEGSTASKRLEAPSALRSTPPRLPSPPASSPR